MRFEEIFAKRGCYCANENNSNLDTNRDFRNKGQKDIAVVWKLANQNVAVIVSDHGEWCMNLRYDVCMCTNMPILIGW